MPEGGTGQKEKPLFQLPVKPDFTLLDATKCSLGLPAHKQHFPQTQGAWSRGYVPAVGRKRLSPPGPLHYLLQEVEKFAANKMEQGEVSWDGLLNTA